MVIFSRAANQITVQVHVEQHADLPWLSRLAVFPHSMLNEGFMIMWKIRHFVTINPSLNLKVIYLQSTVKHFLAID